MPHGRIVILFVIVPFLFTSYAGAQTGRARLISAANVTVRDSPSPGAPGLARLPLGSEVREAGDADLEKTWVRVDLPDGRTGWVLARLTLPLDPVWKWQTYEQVIVERLARKGDGFPAAVELVTFIERIGKDVSEPDARARIDLQWLRAVQHVLLAIPSAPKHQREPYASWLARYKDWVVFDEPGGGYKVAHGAIWKVHDARTRTAAADEIAWFAVSVGLAGECEGDVTCYLNARNLMQGEYLRRHPTGVHAAEAVSAIGDLAMRVGAEPSWRDFDARHQCAALKTSIDALSHAVSSAANSATREQTLATLSSIKKRCP